MLSLLRKISGSIGFYYHKFKYDSSVKKALDSNDKYKILKTAHRIEKGLLIENPRPMWGWEKANSLVDMLAKKMRRMGSNVSSAEKAGFSALRSFIDYKMTSEGRERSHLNSLMEKIKEKHLTDLLGKYDCGGTSALLKNDVIFDGDEILHFERLFRTRHTIREFSTEPIDVKKIEKAIELANKCPSACNRQPFKAYLVSGSVRRKIDGSIYYNADKHIIITGVVSAFERDEYNDWIVNASIFAGYLTLSLHVYCIACCPMRVDLLERSKYYSKIREFCNIPEDERIILEMPIGNYKDNFSVAVSARIENKEIFKDYSQKQWRGNEKV